MSHLAAAKIVLPSFILLLAFVLKLLVDRTVKIPELIDALLELPVDVVFLAVSFLAGFMISGGHRAQMATETFVVCVVVAVVVILLWRRSQRLLTSDRLFLVLGCAVLAYGLSGFALVFAVDLISGGAPI